MTGVSGELANHVTTTDGDPDGHHRRHRLEGRPQTSGVSDDEHRAPGHHPGKRHLPIVRCVDGTAGRHGEVYSGSSQSRV